MKRTRLNRILTLALIPSMLLSMAACGNTRESLITETETTGSEEQTYADSDVTTITFAVPTFCHIEDDRLKLFNEELLNDGYKYQLRINCFEYDFEDNQYFKNIEDELNSGNADVAFLGMGDEENHIYSLINSGAVLNLDEILSSDKGRALYKAFPDVLWETVRCNGHIYSIPQANLDDPCIFAAFNKDYISDKAIENWDGSIDGLYKIVKEAKWDDTAAPRFQYLISDYDFDGMIGCEIRNGLLYDYDTMKIENPLESEKFINYLKVLEQMKNEGFMASSVSYYQNTSYSDEEANLTSGRFLVVLSVGEPQEYLLKDNICIKKIAPYLKSKINTTIGISSKTKKLDAVVDFLGLLYGNEKYGNILIYGKQDVDYKIQNGFAVNMDGTDHTFEFMTKVSMGLFVNIHPVKGELFAGDRKEEYFAFYENVRTSPFIGFEAENPRYGAITEDLDMFLDSLNRNSLENAVKEYSSRFKSDGIDEYLDSARKQWETFNK